MTTAHVDLVVVGGGITGLAAAWEALRQGADVVVLEADSQPGGKLRTSPVAGIPLDESADAFLARVPEAVELCAALGLGDQLVAPATGRAYVWVEGQLRPLPEGQLLGVPTDLEAVEAAAATGLLSPTAQARVRAALAPGPPPPAAPAATPEAPAAGPADAPSAGAPSAGAPEVRVAASGDDSVGAVVRRELGDEVLDKLVAPLVGGIWAGDCDHLSLEVATPALAEARGHGPTLAQGAASVRAAALRAAEGAGGVAEVDARPRRENDAATPARASGRASGDTERTGGRSPTGAVDPTPKPARPVFLAPRGGMGQLVGALATALGDRLRTGHTVTSIEPTPGPGRGRWRVGYTVARRSAAAGGRDDVVTADAVVVTTPTFAAAPLVAELSPSVAATLAAIDYASVALVALAVPRDGIDRPLDGSGFLVPPSAGRLLTACSWTSSKWAHLTSDDESLVLLRASAGRDGDDRALTLDDAKLVDALLADLRDTMGLRAAPMEARVSRWRRSFPQPRPGHLGRVAAVEATLAQAAPGLLLAGAWARGVGIPACIRSAYAATRKALAP